MDQSEQRDRRAAIEAAAYALFREMGYKSTSMMAIAKKARASNETLYRWYGNKAGLVAALVEENARAVRVHLATSIEDRSTPLEMLRLVGPDLLSLVTGERAVLLNRAAVIDLTETDTVGRLIAQHGRETVGPLIAELLSLANSQGALRIHDVSEAAETYISLLIGDTQIRRVTGAMGPLSDADIERRAARAFKQFCRLYAA
ncbi:MAG: TetR/AcrR family transcriptional regulator [Pseudomonadota bacterium]